MRLCSDTQCGWIADTCTCTYACKHDQPTLYCSSIDIKCIIIIAIIQMVTHVIEAIYKLRHKTKLISHSLYQALTRLETG